MIIAIYLSKHDMIFDHSFQSFPVCFVWQIFFYNFSLGPVKHILKFYSLFFYPEFLVIYILRSWVTFIGASLIFFVTNNSTVNISICKQPKITNFLRMSNHYYSVYISFIKCSFPGFGWSPDTRGCCWSSRSWPPQCQWACHPQWQGSAASLRDWGIDSGENSPIQRQPQADHWWLYKLWHFSCQII